MASARQERVRELMGHLRYGDEEMRGRALQTLRNGDGHRQR